MLDSEKRTIALALVDAHLQTIMTDYIIFGFDRRENPISFQQEITVLTKEALASLIELISIRLEELKAISI